MLPHDQSPSEYQPDPRQTGMVTHVMRRLAIHHPGGGGQPGQNVFGVTVANLGLYRALARHGGLETLDILTAASGPEAAVRLAASLLGDRVLQQWRRQ